LSIREGFLGTAGSGFSGIEKKDGAAAASEAGEWGVEKGGRAVAAPPLKKKIKNSLDKRGERRADRFCLEKKEKSGIWKRREIRIDQSKRCCHED